MRPIAQRRMSGAPGSRAIRQPAGLFTPKLDMLAILGAGALAAVLAVAFDVAHVVQELAKEHAPGRLEQLLTVLIVSALALTALSMRRALQLRRELMRAPAAGRQGGTHDSSVIATMQQVVFEVDREGRFTFLNPAWTRIMGYSVEETLGRLNFDFVHPQDRGRQRTLVQRAAEGSGLANYEIRCLAKDGVEKWLEAHVRVSVDAHRGIAGCAGTLTDVTERHRAAEALCASEGKFAEQSALLKATLENMNQGIMMIAPDGSVPVINRRAIELLDLPDEFLACAPDSQAIVRWQWDRGDFRNVSPDIQERVEQFLRDGQLRLSPPVFQRQRPNGVVLENRTIPLGNGGLVRTFTDVTEREAGSHAKSAFLATMSHEIRTPLNGVVGTASLLLETELSKEQRRYVETIQECSDTLLELISDILDFSKLEAGRLELEACEFNLVEVTETVLDIVEPRARTKDLLVVFSPAPDLPPRIVGDPGRLRQVLLNLTGNAIKFTASGSVVLKVFSRAGEQGPLLRFEVQDTGVGIPDEARGRLFEEFSQGEASVTRTYGGTGLGLAICKRIVAAMGGRIGFDSRVGEGSVFWFELPLQAAAETASCEPERKALGAGRRVLLAAPGGPGRDAVAQLLAGHGFQVVGAGTPGQDIDIALLHHMVLPAAPFSRRPDKSGVRKPWIAFGFGASRRSGSVDAVIDGTLKPSELAEVLAELLHGASPHKVKAKPKQQVATRRLRVLLVEDNHVNQRVAAKILKNMGHEVELAADGCEAVAQVRSRTYDLALMDMQMPRMDGLEATRAIRALPGDAARLPIVAMTANAFSSDRDACFAAGMDDFISKPVNRDKLFNILEHWGAAGAHAPAQAEAAPAGSAGLVDRTQLELLREELGDDSLGQLLASFRASAVELSRDIQAAIVAGDRTTTEELVHRLKGSAATLSFAAIAEACEQLRVGLHGPDPLAIGEPLAKLLKSLRESEDFMRSEGTQAQAA